MYQPSEETKQRIRERSAHYSNEFFDSLVDVIYMGLKIKLAPTSTQVYEMFFYDAESTTVTLLNLVEDTTFTAEIASCIVWNEYEGRAIGSLQSVIDVLETLMPKEI